MEKELEGRVNCCHGMPADGKLGLMSFSAFRDSADLVTRDMCIVLDFEKPIAVRLLAVGALFDQIKALADKLPGSGRRDGRRQWQR